LLGGRHLRGTDRDVFGVTTCGLESSNQDGEISLETGLGCKVIVPNVVAIVASSLVALAPGCGRVAVRREDHFYVVQVRRGSNGRDVVESQVVKGVEIHFSQHASANVFISIMDCPKVTVPCLRDLGCFGCVPLEDDGADSWLASGGSKIDSSVHRVLADKGEGVCRSDAGKRRDSEDALEELHVD